MVSFLFFLAVFDTIWYLVNYEKISYYPQSLVVYSDPLFR